MTTLKRVDNLVITFLVDNTIEWFTKLPPGFTQELRLQLSQDPPIDEATGVPCMDLENFCCGAHGFSVLIETRGEGESRVHHTVFDTGPESRSIARNVPALKIPVEKVDRVVLSHWHADHSGGIPSFLRMRNEAAAKHPGTKACIVDLHPNRPIARGIAPPPHSTVLCRLPPDPTFEEVESLGAVVEKHAEGHTVAGETVWVSGEIPRVTTYEGGILGGVRWVTQGADKGEWVRDELIMDERYVAVDVVGKGLVLFSSCSHAGIVNVALDAVKTFNRPIYMVVGGLHLGGPELAPRIEPTVDFFAKKLRPSPTYILPMHCSGFPVKVALEKALGEACVVVGTGMRAQIEGDKEAEKAMFPPTISQ